MKCPLFCIGNYSVENIKRSPNFDCLKEECAWWDLAHMCCAMIALNQTFVAVGNVVGRIADRKSINVQVAK